MARSRFSSGIHSSLLSSSQSIRLASAAFLWDFTASITTSSLSALAFLARAQPSSSSLSFDLRSSFSSQRCLAPRQGIPVQRLIPLLALGLRLPKHGLVRFSLKNTRSRVGERKGLELRSKAGKGCAPRGEEERCPRWLNRSPHSPVHSVLLPKLLELSFPGPPVPYIVSVQLELLFPVCRVAGRVSREGAARESRPCGAALPREGTPSPPRALRPHTKRATPCIGAGSLQFWPKIRCPAPEVRSSMEARKRRRTASEVGGGGVGEGRVPSLRHRHHWIPSPALRGPARALRGEGAKDAGPGVGGTSVEIFDRRVEGAREGLMRCLKEALGDLDAARADGRHEEAGRIESDLSKVFGFLEKAVTKVGDELDVLSLTQREFMAGGAETAEGGGTWSPSPEG